MGPEQASADRSHLEDGATSSAQTYRLTVKRGLLALLIMYACQTLAGITLSYGARFIRGADSIDLPTIGMSSVLIGGSLVLLWAWTDIRRWGPSFLPQIGLRHSVIKKSQAVLLILLLLSSTHLLAWVYRSVLLPLLGQGGIIGGGSQMFAHIRETGSVLGMAGFLVLALVVGPVMEEVVFRGYLQSALARRLPGWAALSITSIVFMAGHGPMILWPMYFLYSIAWGWLFMHTGSLRTAIFIHVLSNLFYTVIAVMGWEILA